MILSEQVAERSKIVDAALERARSREIERARSPEIERELGAVKRRALTRLSLPPRGSRTTAPTARQRMVLSFIQTNIDIEGYPPTLREVSDFMGFSSTNGARDHFCALERKGYLTRKGSTSRGLKLTPAGKALLSKDAAP